MSQPPKMEVEMNKLMCERVNVLADLRNNELTHSKVSPRITRITRINIRKPKNSVVIAKSCNAQGLALPHILVLPTRPAPWSGNVFPSLRRGAVQSCIVIVSL